MIIIDARWRQDLSNDFSSFVDHRLCGKILIKKEGEENDDDQCRRKTRLAIVIIVAVVVIVVIVAGRSKWEKEDGDDDY